MSDGLGDRLNRILARITSSEFLSGSGIGNEIAFYIFDYAPEHELRVREHIDFLIAQFRVRQQEAIHHPCLRVLFLLVQNIGEMDA